MYNYNVQLSSQCHLIPLSLHSRALSLSLSVSLSLSFFLPIYMSIYSNFLLMICFHRIQYYSCLRRIFHATTVCTICDFPCTKHQINNSRVYYFRIIICTNKYKALCIHETSVLMKNKRLIKINVFSVQSSSCIVMLLGAWCLVLALSTKQVVEFYLYY